LTITGLKVLIMIKKTNSSKPSFKRIFIQAALGIYHVFPMILGVLGLSALLLTFITPEQVKTVFTGKAWSDALFGTISGSIMMGNAMISYILGGELLKLGVSLFAVTAFLLSWVSLGWVQIPLETSFFGKKFVIYRNILSLLFTLLISILIVFTYEAVR